MSRTPDDEGGGVALPVQRSRTTTWGTIANARFFRFGMVGVANTATDFLLFAFLVQAIGMHVAVANVLSYSAGVLQSFTINSAWTFRGAKGSFVVFCLVNVISLAISTALVWLLSLMIPPLVAKAAAAVASFVVNFSLSRRLVFGNADPSAARQSLGGPT